MQNKLKAYVPITDIICNISRWLKKLKAIKFQGKPVKIKPLKNSIKPKKQKVKIFKYKVIKTFIHGFLHLLGFDHVKFKDYKKMLKEEEKIYQSVIKKVN